MKIISIEDKRKEEVEKDREKHLHIEATIEILENTNKMLKTNNLEELADLKKQISLAIKLLRNKRKWSVQRY